jgi:RNA polymerase sigma-70 factor (ECF subfamily)
LNHMQPARAAITVDDSIFIEATESFRRELLAHCYRMLGSLHDAEDLVQETYLRAAQSYDQFEGRSTVRTWLYRIATNACLSALSHRSRRYLPSGLGGPESDPTASPGPADLEVRWLEPIPDASVSSELDPAELTANRENLRLALIATLQYLPGRQRAVLILRDVLAFPAAEVGTMLGVSTASVKSTLQRARARLRALSLVPDEVSEPTGAEAQALLERYITAFETADADALEWLLSRDASLEATPFRTWFTGNTTCIPYLRLRVMGAAGDWRMLPTRANGQPAAAAYVRGEGSRYTAYGIVVLTCTSEGISEICSFGDPALVVAFGFPATLRNNRRAS